MTDYIQHELDTDDYADAVHTCAECGHALTLVRPGKWQCDHCDSASLLDRMEPIELLIVGAWIGTVAAWLLVAARAV